MASYQTNIVYEGALVSDVNEFPVKFKNQSLGKGDLTADAWGVQKVSAVTSLFHGLFTFDVPMRQWLAWVDGVETLPANSSGAVISDGAALKITSSPAHPLIVVGSKRHPRYQPNRGHIYSASIILPHATYAGRRDFGLFTEENGVFFRLKSNGKLYAVLRSNSVETHEEEIDTSVLTGFDVSKGNIYDIQFQWRGVGSYFFFIGDPLTAIPKLVHTFDLLGTLDALSMQNPALPCRFEVAATGSDTLSLYCGCIDVSSENGLPAEKAFYTSAVSNTITTTTDTPILCLRQPTTINSKHNTRDIRLLRITVSSDKKGTLNFYVTRDATAITGGAWSAVDGGSGSYVEQNKTATSIDTAKLSLVTPILIDANATRQVVNPAPDIVDFILVHGDYIVITGTGSSASMQCVVEWGEEV